MLIYLPPRMQKISNSSKTKVTFFDEVDIDPVQLLSVCPVLGYPAFMNFCWKIVLSTTFFLQNAMKWQLKVKKI